VKKEAGHPQTKQLQLRKQQHTGRLGCPCQSTAGWQGYNRGGGEGGGGGEHARRGVGNVNPLQGGKGVMEEEEEEEEEEVSTQEEVCGMSIYRRVARVL